MRSRPLRVDVLPGRTTLRIVLGGERRVTTTAHAAAVSASPGWSTRDGTTLRAARAAALAGAWLHGRAGDLASEELGEVSVLAGDVADRIGRAWPPAS